MPIFLWGCCGNIFPTVEEVVVFPDTLQKYLQDCKITCLYIQVIDLINYRSLYTSYVSVYKFHISIYKL